MTCTQSSHATLRTIAGDAYRTGRVPVETDARALLATARPWPALGLVIGECKCGSTLSIHEDA